MQLVYSVGTNFAWKGQGITSYYSLKEFFRRGFIRDIFCLCHKSSEMDPVVKDFLPGPFGYLDERLMKAVWKLGFPKQASYFNSVFFDLVVSKRVEKADIFFGWQGHCLRSLRKAKRLGSVTILECCNSHIENACRIVSEENKRYGLCEEDTSAWIKRLKSEYREADYLSCPSKFVVNSFLERGFDEGKIIHVPYGVDTAKFKPGKKKDTTFRVLFVGAVVPRKGVRCLLRAWRELKLRNAELVLCGGVPKRVAKTLEALSDESVKFLGNVGRVERFYMNSDLFVFPTLEDGFGLVLLEAMASGLPVIATKNSGGPDVIFEGKDGFVVEAGNCEQVMERIRYFYDNPEEIKRFGRNARKKAMEFTWSKRGNELVKKFKELLE